MSAIKVAVAGGTGRVGREVVRYLTGVPDIEVVAVLGRQKGGKLMSQIVPELPYEIPIYSSLTWLQDTTRPDVFVDFTPVKVAKEHFYACVKQRINPVIGSTGFSLQDVEEFQRVCAKEQFGAALIPNFSIGAMITQQASAMISRLFQDVSIIEMYPHRKKDAPSGTSAKLRDFLQQQAGINGEIPIHSVRIDGLVSHQEIKFGASGETVTLVHEVTDRSCFGLGVAWAVKAISRHKRLITELVDLVET